MSAQFEFSRDPPPPTPIVAKPLLVRAAPAKQSTSRASFELASMTSEVLLALDLACLGILALLGILLEEHGTLSGTVGAGLLSEFGRTALIATLLAPFILYDRDFGNAAGHGQIAVLVRSHALRFTLLTAVVFALGFVSDALHAVPLPGLLIWFALSLFMTSTTRVVIAQYVRRLQRQGVLTEVIAIVGAGPVADRLVQELLQSRPETTEILGVFDDKVIGAPACLTASSGTLETLIELGKTQKIDWILLTLPPTADQRLLSIVARLKALSVPIALCPQNVGLSVPHHAIGYVAGHLPVSLLAERPIERWTPFAARESRLVPRWIVTLALIPVSTALMAVRSVTQRRVARLRRATVTPLSLVFDDFDLERFLSVAARFGQDAFGYVVTPNADHLIRLHEDLSFRNLYAGASYTLLDSRFVSHLLRVVKGVCLPVCTGSDLTAALLTGIIARADAVVIVGGTAAQASFLREKYQLANLAHFDPPMGFSHDPLALEECLQFVELHSPFRFCLLAVGAPQQELVANLLKTRGKARGLALCVGASINFLTGAERRAPRWMQLGGLEWAFRLLSAPRRMARRYLIRGPRVFGVLRSAELELRRTSSTPVLVGRGTILRERKSIHHSLSSGA